MMKMMDTTDHVMNFATPPYNWGCLPRCSGADTAADIPGEQGSHWCAGCRESPPRLAALCGPAKLVAAAATGRGLPPGSAVLLTDLTVRRLRTRRESKCRQGSAAVPVVQSLRRPVARRRRRVARPPRARGPYPWVFVASRTGARLLIGSSLLCEAHRQ